MSDFEKSCYIKCKVHKKERFLFFRKCWKCEIKKRCKNISEAKLLIQFKNHLKT